jgi:carboxyl-terminal processing protease
LFALEYVDRHRNELTSKYSGIDPFNGSFEITNQILDQFVRYSSDKGVTYKAEDYSVSKSQLALLLKAYMARDLFTNSAFYEVTNQKDPKFETAVNILQNWGNYEAMLLNKK